MDVDKMADQARLWLDDAEKPAIQAELRQMVAFVGTLAALDTEGVPPTVHPLPLENVLRPDEPGPALPRQALLENAPETQDGFILVPKVVE